MATKAKAEKTIPQQLEALALNALAVAKTAKRHGKSLKGVNFYADKLATMRADATNLLRSLSPSTAGDTSAIAELMETTFSASADSKERAKAGQELCFNLRTTWKEVAAPREDEGLFPLSILSQAKRGYLVTVGRQMNGSFTSGWYDAASVMMRRLVEIAIIEAFEGKAIASKIKNAAGDYVQLSDLVAATLSEATFTLSRNFKKALPGLRDVGHMSAHGRYFTAKKEDLEKLKPDCRIVVEELLHHAGLL